MADSAPATGGAGPVAAPPSHRKGRKPCKFGTKAKCGNPSCAFLHSDDDGAAAATPVKAPVDRVKGDKELGGEKAGKSATKADKDKADTEKAGSSDKPDRERSERPAHPTVLTLRVRLRAWIPAEDLSSVRGEFSKSWFNSLHVETLVPEREGHAEGTDSDAWAEIQLLGEGRGVFEAFAQLERAVGGEVDDVVLAFPVAADRLDRLCASSSSSSSSADPLGHIKHTSAATGARIFVPGRTNVAASSLTAVASSSSAAGSRAASAAARSASALAVSEAPPVEVLLEGAFPAVRSAFGLCVERLMSGPAREWVSTSFEVPGALIGPLIGEWKWKLQWRAEP